LETLYFIDEQGTSLPRVEIHVCVVVSFDVSFSVLRAVALFVFAFDLFVNV